MNKEQSCDYCDEGRPRDEDGWHARKYTAHGWQRCKLWTPAGTYRDATGELVIPAAAPTSKPIAGLTALLREARDFVGKSRCSVGHSVSEVIDRAKPGMRHCLYCERQLDLYQRLTNATVRLAVETPAVKGTYACPICGKDTPHVHKPGARDERLQPLTDAQCRDANAQLVAALDSKGFSIFDIREIDRVIQQVRASVEPESPLTPYGEELLARAKLCRCGLCEACEFAEKRTVKQT